MPGFLDVAGYGGTERIPLPAGYWVDVRRSLSSPEYEPVQRLLGAGKQSLRADAPQVVIDPSGAMREMLFQSVVAWNLDDPDGTEWPLEPDKARRESISRLPNSVLQQVYGRCDELNGPRSGDEAVTFPDPALGSDTNGNGGTA